MRDAAGELAEDREALLANEVLLRLRELGGALEHAPFELVVRERIASSARFRSVMSRAMPVVPMTSPASSTMRVLIVSIQYACPVASTKGSSTRLWRPVLMTSASSAR